MGKFKDDHKSIAKIKRLEKKDKREKAKKEYKELKEESDFLTKTKKNLIKEKINKKKEKIRAHNRALNEPPVLNKGEEIANAITHGIGFLFGACTLVLMLVFSKGGLHILSACFYGISIIAVMVNSCLYHSFKSGKTVKRLWRRFDYLSIYLLIGGTYAPLLLIFLGGTLGLVLFCVHWGIIIFGVTFISIYGPGRFKWIHFSLYFILGWIGILLIPYFIKYNLMLLMWILVGGAVYTLGMIPFAIYKKKKYSHFLWHIFVLIGALLQWLGIFFELYL